MIYCLFATSKDVTIGPTAVMALTTGQILGRINAGGTTASNVAVATCLAMMSGIVMLGIGLLRLGFILDFIPGPVIAGFTTGGAVTVVITQIPAFFGVKGVDTRADTYLVVAGIFKNLGSANWVDALFGLLSAGALLALKMLARKYGKRSLIAWYAGVSRFAIVVLFSILVSWLVNRTHPESPYNSILKTVPSGFTYVAVPPLANHDVAMSALSGLPVIVLLALLEHISIAKSFGRINGYKINPSQESVAIGVTNIAASFFGGFPSTGSFSRTAVKSQAGVRTPLAGTITGLVVLLAIFVLAPVFYWIPSATLAAVIMHGITELVSPPSYFKRLWQISRPDFIVTFVTIVLSVVMTVELAIEASVVLALVFLLLRLALPAYSLLARDGATGEWTAVRELQSSSRIVRAGPPGVLVFRLEESLIYPNSNHIRSEVWDVVCATTKDQTPNAVEIAGRSQTGKAWSEYAGKWERRDVDVEFGELVGGVVADWQRNAGFIVEREGSGSVASVGIGIEVEEVKDEERKEAPSTNHGGLLVPGADDPLYNSGAKSTVSTAFAASETAILHRHSGTKPSFADKDLPPLRAIIFDFSAVNTVDSTGAQTLLDLLSDAARRSGGQGVQMHFVHARRKVRRVLERSGVIAAQIPVLVQEDGGVKLENVEIAVEGQGAGSKNVTFNAWRTIKGLRFGRKGQEGTQQAEQDLEAGQPAYVGDESQAEPTPHQSPRPSDRPRNSIAGASVAAPQTPPGEAVTSLTGIQEAALTTSDEVIEATVRYAARFMHGNVEDAIEMVEELERERTM